MASCRIEREKFYLGPGLEPRSIVICASALSTEQYMLEFKITVKHAITFHNGHLYVLTCINERKEKGPNIRKRFTEKYEERTDT